jgi:uncharacterized DUF497 family protein
MRLEWGETKRLANFAKHNLDFDDAAEIFEGYYLELEDTK